MKIWPKGFDPNPAPEPTLEEKLRQALGKKVPLGRLDPAYIPTSPTELLEMSAARAEQRPFKVKTWSAAELESYVRKAPTLEELRERPQGQLEYRTHYDDTGRLAAKMALEHLERVPEDIALSDLTFWRGVESTHPFVEDLQLTTYQRWWAHAAAQRIFDALNQ